MQKTVKCHASECLFCLTTAIEDLAAEKYDCCVFHGSAVSYRSKESIAFVGKSGSGKTTMMLNLINNNWNSISDDLLFVSDDAMLSTVFLPYKIKPTKIDSNRINIGKINLKRANITEMTTLFQIKAIVSINYDMLDKINVFSKYNFINAFSVLVKNSRKAVDTKMLSHVIASILKRTPIYNLNYFDTSFAVDSMLESIILA